MLDGGDVSCRSIELVERGDGPGRPLIGRLELDQLTHVVPAQRLDRLLDGAPKVERMRRQVRRAEDRSHVELHITEQDLPVRDLDRVGDGVPLDVAATAAHRVQTPLGALLRRDRGAEHEEGRDA